MLKQLTTFAGLALAFALTTAACKTKPPRQAEADDAVQDKGADMPATQEQSGPVADTGEKEGTEKMHAKCCGQCKEGLASDRTGAKPETIPCTDFTSTLDPFCLEHFRGKKTMASECK